MMKWHYHLSTLMAGLHIIHSTRYGLLSGSAGISVSMFECGNGISW